MGKIRPRRRKTFRRAVLLSILGLAGLSLLVFCQCTSVSRPEAGRTLEKTSDPAQAEAMRRHVDMLTVTAHPRSFMDRDNQQRVKDYIERELKQAGCRVSRQTVPVGNVEFENVIGLLPGKTSSKIIVGAHYDSCGKTPGADDNASAVAGLLELARLLAKTPLNHTVELVAYCNEEPPHFGTQNMGSAHHAALVRSRKDDVTLMICLEMIGYYSDEPGSQEYPLSLLKLSLPTTGNFIGLVGNWDSYSLTKLLKNEMGKVSSLPVARANFPDIPGMTLDFSDHRNYWASGYPAVMVTDTAFYRNPHYHQPTDTADTLDYRRMSDVVQSLCKAILALDHRVD